MEADERSLPAASDVARQGEVLRQAGAFGRKRQKICGNDVIDMAIIARSGSVAKDGARFADRHVLNPSRDDGGIGTVWILSRSEDVKIAQSDDLHAISPSPRLGVDFLGAF